MRCLKKQMKIKTIREFSIRKSSKFECRDYVAATTVESDVSFAREITRVRNARCVFGFCVLFCFFVLFFWRKTTTIYAFVLRLVRNVFRELITDEIRDPSLLEGERKYNRSLSNNFYLRFEQALTAD